MFRKIYTVFSLLVLASLFLAACGGGSAPATAPAPFSKLTVNTKAEDLRKTMEDKEKASLPAGYKVDLIAYATDATADEVTGYYKDALKDWSTQDPGTLPAGTTMLKWSKGTDNVFVLIVTANPDGSAGQAVYTEFVSK